MPFFADKLHELAHFYPRLARHITLTPKVSLREVEKALVNARRWESQVVYLTKYHLRPWARAVRALQAYERAARRVTRRRLYSKPIELFACLDRLKVLNRARVDLKVKRRGSYLVSAPAKRGRRPAGAKTSLVDDLRDAGLKRELARKVADIWLKHPPGGITPIE